MTEKLKPDIGILRMNFMQMLISRNFYISVIAILTVLFISVWELGMEWAGVEDVCFIFQMILDTNFFPELIVLLAAMPAVSGFCSDWNTQYIRSVAGRTGTEKYARHKVLICLLGTFLTAFVSCFLFVLILLLKYPLYSNETFAVLESVEPLGSIMNVAPFLHLTMRIFCYSVFCSFWASFGLAFSAYIPNRFIACSMPLLFKCIIETIIIKLDTVVTLPTWLLIPYLGTTSMCGKLFGNAFINFLYVVLFFVCLSLAVSSIFVRGVKRRMRNELV